MRCKPNMLGGIAIAAISGAMILGATPGFAAPASQPATQKTGANMQSPAPSANQMKPGTAEASTAKATAKPAKMTKAAADEPVTKVSDPEMTLAAAKVQDASGKSVGTVTGVQTSKSGAAKSIKVSLSGRKAKTVAIKANKLRYAPTTHLLKAGLTRAQIRALPAVQSP